MGPDRIKPMPPGYTATIWPMSEEAKERVRKSFEDVYAGKAKAIFLDPETRKWVST